VYVYIYIHIHMYAAPKAILGSASSARVLSCAREIYTPFL